MDVLAKGATQIFQGEMTIPGLALDLTNGYAALDQAVCLPASEFLKERREIKTHFSLGFHQDGKLLGLGVSTLLGKTLLLGNGFNHLVEILFVDLGEKCFQELQATFGYTLYRLLAVEDYRVETIGNSV